MELLKQLHDVWEEYKGAMIRIYGNEYTSPINDEVLLQIALEDEIDKMQALMIKIIRNDN